MYNLVPSAGYTYLYQSRIVTRLANFIFLDTESCKTLLEILEHLQN